MRPKPTAINEIAPGRFRLSSCAPDLTGNSNTASSRMRSRLMFPAGLNKMFPAPQEAVAKLFKDTRRI